MGHASNSGVIRHCSGIVGQIGRIHKTLGITIMTEDTRADALIKRIKNHKLLSFVVAAGLVFLALVSFAEGLQKAGDILGKAFSSSSLISHYDASTKDALIAAAHEVDYFFLLIESSPEKTSFSSIAPTYIKIKSDLRSILLRNKIRPLNAIAVKQSELLLDQWSNVEKLLMQPDGSSPKAMEFVREIMFQSFEATLMLEEAKMKTEK